MSKGLTLVLFYIITAFSIVNFAQAPNITSEPLNQGVIEGQTASFIVLAQGDSLTYQWFKNDTLIVAGTDSAYTTPATVLSDNLSEFYCVVTNPSGTDTSRKAILFVTASGSRVTEGMQLLYTFKEGSGSTVNDSSGVGAPYNLDIYNQSSVTWTPNGLGINSLPFIKGGVPLSKVISSSQQTNELSVEVWIQPTSVNYNDYPRIIALSDDQYTHNEFSLMQNPFGGLDFLVRTNNTDNVGKPGVVSPNNIIQKRLTHIVCTFSENGERKIFKDGVQIASVTSAGNFSTWDTTARLELGNQTPENVGWLGSYYLVSIYNRALSQTEVTANFGAGVSADQKPEIIVEPLNQGTIAGQTLSFNIRAAGDSLSYQWRKDGVNISGANLDSFTTSSLLLTDDKAEYSCVVTNSYGSDTSRNAQIRVNDPSKRIEGGRLAVYTFQEDTSGLINDVLGYEPTPLRINAPDTLRYQWKPYGLIVFPGADILSASQATKWYNDVGVGTGEFTFEAWIKPSSLNQYAANILSIGNAGDTNKINFVMEQYGNTLLSRLRTSTTSEYGVSLESPSNSFGDSLLHIVFIHNTKEISKLYINGVQVVTDYQFGDLTNWNPVYYIRIGEQSSGAKPWQGLYNYLAFYLRALDPTEITHNYAYGATNVSLTTPYNLTAQVNVPGKVELAWSDTSNNKDGFIIERKYGVIDFSVIDSVGVNTTSFTDSSVVDSTIYTYRIKSFNYVRQSAYSNTASDTTLLSTVNAPSNLLAVPSPSDSQIVKLTWVDNSSNENGFILERKLGDTLSVEPFVVLDTLAADITSYEDSVVTDTTTYTYRVMAFNVFINSDYSNLAQITTPVPVELVSFTANFSDRKVLLAWETATELNNAGFSVQRSKDNSEFIDLAFVRGNGTTTSQSSYNYVDKSPISGKYYYRLKQIDLDGSSSYSKTVEVEIGLPKNYALEQNYPNPFNPSTTIRFALPVNAKVNLKLFNALGQVVATLLNTDLDAGVHETVFNASNLSSGVYFYSLTVQGINGSNYNSTKRMILIK